ncbi:MAG: VOC family protein [Variibacter sp.]
MPLKHILGLDHVVINVRDLDASAQTWKTLGFAVSPRGTHSAHLGSGNYTIVFGDDYLELLGVITETEHLRPTIEFLKHREGIERAAFTTDDAAAGAEELKARGLAPLGPVHFGRPVDLPNGGKSEAKFNVFRWPLNEQPGGLRIFACQHLTRENVWIPELQHHANGAQRIVRLEILSQDPKAAAEQLSHLIDEPVSPTADGFRVHSGGRRADFLFYDAATFARLYPVSVRAGAAPEGAVALVIATSDVAKAQAASGAVSHDGRASVPAQAATGVIVSFVPQQAA